MNNKFYFPFFFHLFFIGAYFYNPHIKVELKSFEKEDRSILKINILNSDCEDLYIPNFSIYNCLKFFDSDNNDITDSASYILRRETEPLIFIEKQRKRNKNYISTYEFCTFYETSGDKYEVNKVLMKAIDLEYLYFQDNNLTEITTSIDSGIIKEYLMNKYCPLMILPNKICVHYYINLSSVVRKYGSVKVIVNLDAPTYDDAFPEKVFYSNDTLNFYKSYLEEIDKYHLFNCKVSESITVSYNSSLPDRLAINENQ